MQTCHRNVGFCKKYTKKLQTFYKICVETQKINISISSAILLQKHCISIKKICICKDFRHSDSFKNQNGHPSCRSVDQRERLQQTAIAMLTKVLSDDQKVTGSSLTHN